MKISNKKNVFKYFTSNNIKKVNEKIGTNSFQGIVNPFCKCLFLCIQPFI